MAKQTKYASASGSAAVLDPPEAHQHARPSETEPRRGSGQPTDLAQRYAITESSLTLRRSFIRLGESERATIESLIPWIQARAERIAKEFYDWQFEFPPTRQFFSETSARKGTDLA